MTWRSLLVRRRWIATRRLANIIVVVVSLSVVNVDSTSGPGNVH